MRLTVDNKLNKPWAVFSTIDLDAAESIRLFNTYRDAVFYAQCIHDTLNRPKREGSMYRVSGEFYSSFVVRTERLSSNGFGWLLDKLKQSSHELIKEIYETDSR